MKHNSLLILVIGIFLATSLISQVSAWPDSTIYVQETSTAPEIDGIITPGEWRTDEETFTDGTDSIEFDQGAVAITFKLVILRDADNVYFLVKFELDNTENFVDEASIGIALSDESITNMKSTKDRKIIVNSVENGTTTAYDLHNCELSACTSLDPTISTPEEVARGIRERQPGEMDTSQDLIGAYGSDGNVKFFEISFPLIAADAEDIDFDENVRLKIVLNPFESIYAVGHGGLGSDELQVTFSPKSFFPRPAGPMDGLAIAFTALFSVVIIGMSLALIITARNDNLAEKFLRVDITEEMKNKSIIMEIGYYNSGFIALFSMFYFWLLALVSVLYGWWANWGTTGLIINLPALILSSYAGYDQIKRNHNPQDIPEEERRTIGKDIEKTNSLWIFPPAFLFLVLFMLVFVGIDVIS